MNATRILIVEDEMIFARNLQVNLEKIGCRVEAIVRSGEDALIAGDRYNPDIVMMDIHLDGTLDGIETAQLLKQRNIPVIFLTAFGDQETLDRAKIAEPYGYLTKPVDFNQLPYVIEIATYKHRMGKRLRESENLFSAILHSISDGVIATNQSDRVILINPSAESLTGWSTQEAIGQPLNTVYRCTAESSPAISAKPDELQTQEATLKHRDGHLVPIRHRTASMIDSQGRTLGSVIVFDDITEQKRYEREREASIEKLQRALASIKTLSGLIPICANCKKIRTDSGYWMQVEQYVKEHSNADFTHSICPSCITELYPKLGYSETE